MHDDQLLIMLPLDIEHGPGIDPEKYQCSYYCIDQSFDRFVHGLSSMHYQKNSAVLSLVYQNIVIIDRLI